MNTSVIERMRAKGFKDDASLAVAVGCDRSMINRIRQGKATPSLRLAAKLAETLDMEPADFLSEPTPAKADAA